MWNYFVQTKINIFEISVIFNARSGQEDLTPKHLHGWFPKTVSIDAMMLMHQTISNHSATKYIWHLTSFIDVYLSWTTLDDRTKLKKELIV